MGAIRDEIERRLRENFAPLHLAVIDDSEKHHGHAGHDPRGESHFSGREPRPRGSAGGSCPRARHQGRSAARLMHCRP